MTNEEINDSCEERFLNLFWRNLAILVVIHRRAGRWACPKDLVRRGELREKLMNKDLESIWRIEVNKIVKTFSAVYGLYWVDFINE